MSKIYQGTTAINEFVLEFSTEMFEKLKVSYRQVGNVRLVKRLGEEGVSAEGNVLTVHFTQEETFYFDHKEEVEIQLRGKTLDGEVWENEPIVVTVGECFDREVL